MARKARILTAPDGTKATLEQWSATLGVSVNTLKSRIRIGWTEEEVLGFKEHVGSANAMVEFHHPNQFDDGSGRQTHARQAKFLDEYIECGKVTEAADKAKVDFSSYFEWLQDDDIFRAACSKINDWWTQKLRDKILTILEVPEEYKDLVNHPNVLFFELKRRDPEYRDNAQTNIYNQTLTLGEVDQLQKMIWSSRNNAEQKMIDVN